MTGFTTRRFATLLGVLWTLGLAAPEAWASTRVMILPFEAPRDPAQVAALGPGTMDSLITALAQVPEFVVVDRTSLTHLLKENALADAGFVHGPQAMRLGKVLGVQAVISGRVQVVGDHVRLSASFVDLESGRVELAQQVTGDLTTVFDLQDQLARRFIADRGVRLTPPQAQRMTDRLTSTANMAAYAYYQRGREGYLRSTPEGYAEALGWYAEALKLDPDYALAYAGQAEAMARWGYYKMLSAEPYQPTLLAAKASALKALSLCPDSPEAHRAMALAQRKLQEPDTDGHAARALALAPHDAESLTIHWMVNDAKPDSPQILDAMRLSPQLILAHLTRGVTLLAQRRASEAAREFQIVTRLSPDEAMAHNYLGVAFLQQGDHTAARQAFERALAINPTYGEARRTLDRLNAGQISR